MFSTAIFSGSRTSAKHQLLLREAVAAIKKGDRAVARTLLREIVHGDPRNPHAWLWMAGVADSVAEVTHCLEKVIEVEPENQMANERLSMLRLLRYASSDGSPEARASLSSIAPVAPSAPSVQVAVRGSGAVAAHGSPASSLSQTPPRLRPNPHAISTVCVLCQSDIDVRKHQCSRCGSIASLRSMQDIFSNRATDLNLIKSGVERWKQEHERKATPESSFALTLGYLNLHDFQKAIEYLQVAHRLSPDRKDLFEALDKLERCPVVLVVDDSATIRHLVAHTLHAAGYVVRMAEDGVKALSMLQDGLPDLIFMDINMPRMDGYQVCRVIKHDETTKRVPVVMLSGKDGFFDKVKGRLAGSAEYITKPFEGDSLIRSVEKHIVLHKRGGVDRTLAPR
jgi:twitching motility two-component system response regulator PilG